MTVSYYIFGGTPPYRVAFPVPGGLTLLNSVVAASGGHFDVVTTRTMSRAMVLLREEPFSGVYVDHSQLAAVRWAGASTFWRRY